MSQPQTKIDQAVRLLRRKSGATIDQLVERVGLASQRQARGLIDRVKRRGTRVERIAPKRFKLAA